MRYKSLFLLITLILNLSAYAENIERKSKKFSFGINGGVNAPFIYINDYSINGHIIDNPKITSRAGYHIGLVTRWNLGNSFINTEFTYYYSQTSLNIDLQKILNDDATLGITADLNTTMKTFELPVLYGYNLIMAYPYNFNLFIGPKFRYLIHYESGLNKQQHYLSITEKLRPINMSAVIGLGANISNLYFDFRYEAGILNLSESVEYVIYKPTENVAKTGIMNINRRMNRLSFTLGFMF